MPLTSRLSPSLIHLSLRRLPPRSKRHQAWRREVANKRALKLRVDQATDPDDSVWMDNAVSLVSGRSFAAVLSVDALVLALAPLARVRRLDAGVAIGVGRAQVRMPHRRRCPGRPPFVRTPTENKTTVSA